MSGFSDVILADLRAFSGILIEPGTEPHSTDTWNLPSLDTFAGANAAAAFLSGLVPTLIRQLEPARHLDHNQLVKVRRPVRAQVGRSPADWIVGPDGPTPKHWWTSELSDDLPPEPLEWLLQTVQQMSTLLESREERLREQLAALATSQEAISEFGAVARDTLASLATSLGHHGLQLHQVARGIRDVLPIGARPRSRPPTPYPRGSAWVLLRKAVAYWSDPSAALEDTVRQMLEPPVRIAELPFLYERWCVIQVLDVLASLGAEPITQDVVTPIFTGGRIAFSRAGEPLDVWVGPRIGQRVHACGLRTKSLREQTPDVVLRRQTPNGPLAYILDPTMSQDPQILRGKGKYRVSLEFPQPRRIAGLMCPRPPTRAWAVSPLRDLECRVIDVEGHVGVVPLHPVTGTTDALRAWVSDFLA